MSTPAARSSRTRWVAAAEAVSRARATRVERNAMSLALSRPVRAQERAHLPYRDGDQLFGFLPGVVRELRSRRDHRRFPRDVVRVSRAVVEQDEHRRLALADEVAVH